MKKRLLFIAPASFPVGDAEAIVNVKLLQALSRCGNFEIDLVSKKYKHVNYPSGTIESYGIILNSFNIVESDNRITFDTIWKSIVTFFRFGAIFKGCHWAYEALPVIEDLVRKNEYDYVITKNLASYLLGAYLKRKYGIKWVATWNDPKPDSKYPIPYGKGWNNKNVFDTFEIGVMKKADIHIFPSLRLANYMNQYLALQSNKIVILPHVTKDNDAHIRDKHDKLRLIHSGNLAYPRDPSSFLKGLSLFVTNNPSAKIEFNILGRVDDNVKGEIKTLQLNDYVNIISPVEYNRSLELLKDYGIAVIIEANCEEGIFLPTKVSDFMQSNIPIMAISPEKGTLNDLYVNGSIPYFAEVTDFEKIEESLRLVYQDYICDRIKMNVIPQEYKEAYICEQYMRF